MNPLTEIRVISLTLISLITGLLVLEQLLVPVEMFLGWSRVERNK